MGMTNYRRFAATFRRLRAADRMRRDLAALMTLSDRQLEDVGLTRGQLSVGFSARGR